jgi:hypothetical protein
LNFSIENGSPTNGRNSLLLSHPGIYKKIGQNASVVDTGLEVLDVLF